MHLELLPLLQIQRDLHAMPRGLERFQKYIATLTEGGDDLVLPLVGMNPMGKEHVAALLDTLIGFDAEAIVSAAAADAAARLAAIPGRFQVGLVATDDAQGGWTNRYFTELGAWFNLQRVLARGWIVAPIWTSEEWSPPKVRAATLAMIYRSAWAQHAGQPTTLQQMMTQEGFAAVFAAAPEPTLDPDDLSYTREVLAPYRDSTDHHTIFTCLFGDEAARSVGYPPLGLSARAGFALARVEALEAAVTPEIAIERLAAAG